MDIKEQKAKDMLQVPQPILEQVQSKMRDFIYVALFVGLVSVGTLSLMLFLGTL